MKLEQVYCCTVSRMMTSSHPQYGGCVDILSHTHEKGTWPCGAHTLMRDAQVSTIGGERRWQWVKLRFANGPWASEPACGSTLAAW
jgi:hypothetical protein